MNIEEITLDKLRYLIEEKIEKRFNTLQSNRTKKEARWADMISSAMSGNAPKAKKNILTKIYQDLTDNTLPSFIRKLLARETGWLDSDFFRWQPDGVESTDIDGAYWLTDYQRDNLNNELSNFYNAIRASILQRIILNISAINYNWTIIPKYEYSYQQGEALNGILQFQANTVKISPLEFRLQGLKYEFISMFDLYPDIIEQTTFDNLRTLDLYHRHTISLNDIKKNTLYNSEEPYIYKPNVLYRSTEGIELLIDSHYQRSAAMQQLSKNIDLINSKDSLQQKVEIRTVLLKEITFPGEKESQDAEGRGYRLIYAKGNNQIVPLLLEKNPHHYEYKTIRLSRRYIDPYNLYNDSEVGLTINTHNFLVSQKQLQASTLTNAINPTKLWHTALIDAFDGAITEFKEVWTSSGHNLMINTEKLQRYTNTGAGNITSPIILGNPEENLRNIQLLEESIQKLKREIAESHSQVTQEIGAGATAQYNKQVAAELDVLSKESKQSLCQDWLKPSLEYSFEMAKTVFQDSKLVTQMSPEDKTKLEQLAGGASFDQLKNKSQETGQALNIPFQMGGKEYPTTYNPLTEKKATILTKFLFENTLASLKLEFEENEYSKPIELQQKMEIYGQIMANLPDSPLKYLVASQAIKQSLQLTNDPSYEILSQKTEELYQQMIQPPPPQEPPPPPNPDEQEMIQLSKAKQVADIKETESRAVKNTAQAIEKGIPV